MSMWSAKYIQVSADADLNQDFIGLLSLNSGDYLISEGVGAPQNAPIGQTDGWNLRVVYYEYGSSIGSITRVQNFFETEEGQWFRAGARPHPALSLSTSYSPWLKTASFTSPLVESVNSETGVVTVTLNTSGT